MDTIDVIVKKLKLNIFTNKNHYIHTNMMFNRVYYTIRQSFNNIKLKQNNNHNHNLIQYKRHYSVPPNSPYDPKDMMENWIVFLVFGSIYLYYSRPRPRPRTRPI